MRRILVLRAPFCNAERAPEPAPEAGPSVKTKRRLAYPLLHDPEVQASITGAVPVHDRSPHLRAYGSPASSEVNSPRYQRIRSSSLRGPIGAALVGAGSGCHAFLSPLLEQRYLLLGPRAVAGHATVCQSVRDRTCVR